MGHRGRWAAASASPVPLTAGRQGRCGGSKASYWAGGYATARHAARVTQRVCRAFAPRARSAAASLPVRMVAGSHACTQSRGSFVIRDRRLHGGASFTATNAEDERSKLGAASTQRSLQVLPSVLWSYNSPIKCVEPANSRVNTRKRSAPHFFSVSKLPPPLRAAPGNVFYRRGKERGRERRATSCLTSHILCVMGRFATPRCSMSACARSESGLFHVDGESDGWRAMRLFIPTHPCGARCSAAGLPPVLALVELRSNEPKTSEPAQSRPFFSFPRWALCGQSGGGNGRPLKRPAATQQLSQHPPGGCPVGAEPRRLPCRASHGAVRV